MTTLICTGTMFSGWQSVTNAFESVESKQNPLKNELSALNAKICGQRFTDIEELNWGPFTPEEEHLNFASELISKTNETPIFVWADNNSSLLLDFWNAAAKDAKFLLFYSSPEYELSSYFKTNPFNAKEIERIIECWVTRLRAMLTFFMNNREHCLLVNVQTVKSEYGLFTQTIKEKFDLDSEHEPSVADMQPENFNLMEYVTATLMFENDTAAEIFDEVRSAATVIAGNDSNTRDIQARVEKLTPDFLNKVAQLTQFGNDFKKISDELTMTNLQLHQTQEELEFFYLSERDTATLNEQYVDFLNNDPLIRLARLARVSETSEQ
jgi:hypothetical protein